jgi:hypothetical protein
VLFRVLGVPDPHPHQAEARCHQRHHEGGQREELRAPSQGRRPTGIVLWMTAGKAWIIVAGIGAFVPGILRELGVMSDLDEFQRDASRRAAFHAYLVGGLAIVCAITGIHLTGESVKCPAEVVTLLLIVLWLTWLFSYLISFWGAQKTALLVLVAFGAFWTLFGVLSGIGEGGTFIHVLVDHRDRTIRVGISARAWSGIARPVSSHMRRERRATIASRSPTVVVALGTSHAPKLTIHAIAGFPRRRDGGGACDRRPAGALPATSKV